MTTYNEKMAPLLATGLQEQVGLTTLELRSECIPKLIEKGFIFGDPSIDSAPPCI